MYGENAEIIFHLAERYVYLPYYIATMAITDFDNCTTMHLGSTYEYNQLLK